MSAHVHLRNLRRTTRHQGNHRHQPPNPEIKAEIPVLLE